METAADRRMKLVRLLMADYEEFLAGKSQTAANPLQILKDITIMADETTQFLADHLIQKPSK